MRPVFNVYVCISVRCCGRSGAACIIWHRPDIAAGKCQLGDFTVKLQLESRADEVSSLLWHSYLHRILAEIAIEVNLDLCSAPTLGYNFLLNSDLVSLMVSWLRRA
eukprot:scaffold20_cov361-Prasinococcus_capsulatus_cf.AAC.7